MDSFIVAFLVSLLYAAIFVLLFASQWAIYEKAGKPGWYSLIPIYNTIVLLQIIGKPWWWLFLFMIPFVNIIWAIWMMNLLSKSFGKGEGFTVGLIFLSIIFYPILAFGKARYLGPAGSEAFTPASPPEIHPREYNLNGWIISIAMLLIVNGIFWFVVSWFGLYRQGINFIPSFLFGIIPLITAGLLKNKTWRIILILLGTIYFAVQMQQYVMAFMENLS